MEQRRGRSRRFESYIHKGENNEMMYLSIMVYNIAILVFTAYMVIHVHPIWAVCILLIQRIGTKVVRVPIEEGEEDAVDDSIDDVYGMDWNEDDCNESDRDKF